MWILEQITAHAPQAVVEPGDVGRSVDALAQGLASLQQPTPMVFGLQVQPTDRERVVALAARFRGALAQWRGHLFEQHGADGHTFVDGILERHGVVLSTPTVAPTIDQVALDPAERAAFARFEAMLQAPSSLRDAWEHAGALEDDETVSTWVGKPNPEQVRALARLYDHELQRPFPALLLQLLLRFNGVALGPADSDTAVGCVVVPSADLAEPVLWPAGYDDPLQLRNAPVVEGVSLFIIGGLADSGFLGLGTDPAQTDASVYWVPADASTEPATRLAGSVLRFLNAWCDAHLLLEAVLSRSGVPGWS